MKSTHHEAYTIDSDGRTVWVNDECGCKNTVRRGFLMEAKDMSKTKGKATSAAMISQPLKWH